MNNEERATVKQMLAQTISDSTFRELVIRGVDNGISVGMDGHTFGVIGALGAFVDLLHRLTTIPPDIITDYILFACEIVQEQNAKQVVQPPQRETADLSSFIKMFTGKEIK